LVRRLDYVGFERGIGDIDHVGYSSDGVWWKLGHKSGFAVPNNVRGPQRIPARSVHQGTVSQRTRPLRWGAK